MQSLFGLLDRVFHWPRNAQQRNRLTECSRDSDQVAASTPRAVPRVTPCERPHTDSNPRIRAPLTVKLHRDNLRDQTLLPTRLVISGRMADVHAELERLAAMEAMA